MGGTTFLVTGHGETAREAFRNAREEALYEHGHGGYTGTIAEKNTYKVIGRDETMSAYEQANKLLDDDDDRISDKWGPAGAIQISETEWVFFGWASC